MHFARDELNGAVEANSFASIQLTFIPALLKMRIVCFFARSRVSRSNPTISHTTTIMCGSSSCENCSALTYLERYHQQTQTHSEFQECFHDAFLQGRSLRLITREGEVRLSEPHNRRSIYQFVGETEDRKRWDV